ncbi:monovalent cation/H+ antiporter complex subunit F [Sporosalibacterium faouarense]|uniref:monovalent cation/H+ antiporter complex subunit F n=1 Tax=Sporosalibacterium faouarense TaxID=516123 RepID=UPI00141CE960|nr:monovalent cation/H+ antiporter complex subunit F [Sporosalibacterium faouarense]MTI46923.1 cation:proton antiporter [Bacillota bacterium]
MIENVLIISIIVLAITMILCIIRAIKGPTLEDRLMAVNVISTKTVVLISLVSFILKEEFFIDVVLVYALISFISTVIITNVIEKSKG